MEQVAEAAGMTRPAVYRLFFGRRELIEAAAAERIAEIADDIAAGIRWAEESDAGALSETFTQVSIAVIEGLRHDPELGVLLGDDSPVSLHEVVWTPEVLERGLSFWRPWLERAQALGLLRKDLPVAQLSEWLQTVYPSIILRRGMAVEDERVVIERFVLASLALASQPREGGT